MKPRKHPLPTAGHDGTELVRRGTYTLVKVAEMTALVRAVQPFATAATAMKKDSESGLSHEAYGGTVPNLKNWRRLAVALAPFAHMAGEA